MNIKQLIEKLKEYPENMQVKVAQDPEGNGFSSLEDIEQSYFREDWNEIFNMEDLLEQEKEEIGNVVTEVLILWP